MKPRIALLLLALGASLPAAQAQTGNWPEKPVRIIVSYPPGGATDIVGRLVGQKLSEALKQPFIVESRPGAAGNIGHDYVAKAAPDGYTLLVGSVGPVAASVHVYAKLPYDPLRDFAYITMLIRQPHVLVLHPSVPARSVKEFIALARSRAGKLNYASGGPGGSQHLAAELFIMMTPGISMVQVPYKGGAPALNDLVGGQVDLMFPNIAEATPFIRAGRLRVLAVTSVQRSSMLPDVPTMQESGLADFDFLSWLGLVAPAGTPKDVIVKLNATVNKALLSSDLRSRMTDLGLEVAGGTAEEFQAFVKKEIVKYGKIVKASGMELQ
jgi:tripartite-type tricarboxylate transporter receptor subunit TctC